MPFSTELPAAVTGSKALAPSRLCFRDWTSCLHSSLLALNRVSNTAPIVDTCYLQHVLPQNLGFSPQYRHRTYLGIGTLPVR
ncbi:hypothetical protein E2C01_052899 [Portunus trituberculatus]|uniref:Uncharacterized protein n=1 Tax=Portunus trituberculatus TaxID=210409 RepID=A0A5B7GMQ6_PORTR|nr:hypothetical protein [Portunus trituberculatus]